MRNMIGEATREISRDRRKLERTECKSILKMKLAAEKGNKGEALRIARNMVQSRRHAIRLDRTCARLENMAQKMQALQANATVAVYFKKSASIVQRLNSFMTSERIGALSQQMEKEMEILNSTQEMMDETLNAMEEADADAFAEDGEEEGDALSEKAIVEQIFMAAGLSVQEMMPNVPVDVPVQSVSAKTTSSTSNRAVAVTAETTGNNNSNNNNNDDDDGDDADADLAERLNRLKKH